MAEPVTTTALAIAGLGWIGGAVAGGIVGNASDRVFCEVLRGVKTRVAGLRGVPENHDVAQAVRTAQVQALERVIRDYREIGRPEWTSEPYTKPENFFERSLLFCADTVGRCRNLQIKLELDITEPLTAAIDGILALPVHDGPAGERRKALASLAEGAVLDELRSVLDGVRLPDGFETHFRKGAYGRSHFLDLFGAYIVEQFKGNEPFRVVFTTGQLARIEGLAFDATEMLARIEARFGGALESIEKTTYKISTTQNAHGVILEEILARVSGEKGIPIPPLRTILAKLGEANVADDQIAARLEAKADEFLDLREKWSKVTNQHPDLVAVRQDALQKMNAGDLDGARALLAKAREHIRELRHERLREEAALLADEASIDRLQLRYREEAGKLAEAAQLVEFDKEAALGYREQEADALYRQGNEFGDNVALVATIERYHNLLALRPRARVPLDWAEAQNKLGNALMRLGERESGTARLEEAVAAYRNALKERTRERVPLNWAITQNNLGNVLARLGDRESGTARLEEAVAAYRAALEELICERSPLKWATIQNNLGNALMRLGERDSGTAQLEGAVAAYRAALKERTRERAPLDWAATQNNLGNALARLGERESGPPQLEEAAQAYRAALSERTRERVPLDWAATQANLGNALLRLGEQESGPEGTKRLDEAVAACREGLKEATRERVPLQWAGMQNNLGLALWRLGERKCGTEVIKCLEEAVAAYCAALEEYTRDRVPLDWAMTQNNLGIALSTLGNQENGSKRLLEAITAYRAALEERTRERMPLDWAMTQNNLGNALLSFGTRAQDRPSMEEAREAVSGAFDVYMQAGQEHRRADFEDLLRQIDEQLAEMAEAQAR